MGEKKNGNNKGGDGEKKEKGSSNSVFKVDCLCDGCAIKILKCIHGFQGVEAVTTDSSSNKVTVTGPVDPTAIKEKLVKKTKKRVEIISPQPKKLDDKEEKKEKKTDKEKNHDSGKGDEKKPKEAPVTTVDLKLQLKCPCQGCIVKIRKIVADTRGVQELKVDREKELVTVKGTMDIKALAEALKDKLRKNAEIVPLKKEKDGKNEGEENGGGDGGNGKKKNKGGNGAENEAAATGGGGGDGSSGKKNNKGGNGGGNEAAATGGGGGKMEGNKMEFIVQPQFGYMPSYPVYVHALQKNELHREIEDDVVDKCDKLVQP